MYCVFTDVAFVLSFFFILLSVTHPHTLFHLYFTCLSFRFFLSPSFFFTCHFILITPRVCFISIQSKKMALGVICVSRRWQNGGRHQRLQRCHQPPKPPLMSTCHMLTLTHASHIFAAHEGERRERVSIIRCDTSQHKRSDLTWQPRTHATCRCGPPRQKQTLTGIWVYSEIHTTGALMNTAGWVFLFVSSWICQIWKDVGATQSPSDGL